MFQIFFKENPLDANDLGMKAGALGHIFFRSGSDAMQIGMSATLLWFFKAASASRASNKNHSITSVLANEGGYFPKKNYFGEHRHQSLNVFSQMSGNAFWYYAFTGLYKEMGGTSASTEAVLAVTGGTLGAMPGTFAMSQKASQTPLTLFQFANLYFNGAKAPCGGRYNIRRVSLGALCEASRELFYFLFAIPSQTLSQKYFGDDASTSATPQFILGAAAIAALGGLLSGPGNAMSTVFYKSALQPSLNLSQLMPSPRNMGLSCALRACGIFGTFGLAATATAVVQQVGSFQQVMAKR